jgi:hypothetical protein
MTKDRYGSGMGPFQATIIQGSCKLTAVEQDFLKKVSAYNDLIWK